MKRLLWLLIILGAICCNAKAQSYTNSNLCSNTSTTGITVSCTFTSSIPAGQSIVVSGYARNANQVLTIDTTACSNVIMSDDFDNMSPYDGTHLEPLFVWHAYAPSNISSCILTINTQNSTNSLSVLGTTYTGFLVPYYSSDGSNYGAYSNGPVASTLNTINDNDIIVAAGAVNQTNSYPSNTSISGYSKRGEVGQGSSGSSLSLFDAAGGVHGLNTVSMGWTGTYFNADNVLALVAYRSVLPTTGVLQQHCGASSGSVTSLTVTSEPFIAGDNLDVTAGSSSGTIGPADPADSPYRWQITDSVFDTVKSIAAEAAVTPHVHIPSAIGGNTDMTISSSGAQQYSMCVTETRGGGNIAYSTINQTFNSATQAVIPQALPTGSYVAFANTYGGSSSGNITITPSTWIRAAGVQTSKNTGASPPVTLVIPGTVSGSSNLTLSISGTWTSFNTLTQQFLSSTPTSGIHAVNVINVGSDDTGTTLQRRWSVPVTAGDRFFFMSNCLTGGSVTYDDTFHTSVTPVDSNSEGVLWTGVFTSSGTNVVTLTSSSGQCSFNGVEYSGMGTIDAHNNGFIASGTTWTDGGVTSPAGDTVLSFVGNSQGTDPIYTCDSGWSSRNQGSVHFTVSNAFEQSNVSAGAYQNHCTSTSGSGRGTAFIVAVAPAAPPPPSVIGTQFNGLQINGAQVQ